MQNSIIPFYERAQGILQLGPFDYEPEAWETNERSRLPSLNGPVTTKIVQFSPPTRFGQVYRDEIVHAENIRTYLNANAIEIETTRNTQVATHVRLACLQGPKFSVSAKLFILATGGIENARLLLLSNKIQSAGLGNQHDLVGRFFMDHVGVESGMILLSRPNIPTDLYKYHWQKSNRPVLGELVLSPEIIYRERLTNFCTVLKEIEWWEAIKGDDFLSFLSNVLANIDDITKTVYRKFFGPGGRYPAFRLYNLVEPVPKPENRVTLTDERDNLDQNRVRLHWRFDDNVKSHLRRAQELIGREFGRAGLGRVRVLLDNDETSWQFSLDYGNHHMGTTRMHVDPKQGVVDQNCKVHGISNLFIAGSSVFPTYGYSQPTLTIVALALRLADHVKNLLR
jgi:choline dehydrogenase-like flavoprotein